MLRTISRQDARRVCLAAGLLVLSFPRASIAFSSWIGLVPLLLAIEGRHPVRAFFTAYLTGLIFWSGVIYWLIHVTLPGQILLILYLSLYFGAFGFVVSYFRILQRRQALIVVPALWVILEYIRCHALTGFGWGLLGYSQAGLLPVIQIADITGVWGVSFFVAAVNTIIFYALGYRYVVMRMGRLLVFAVCCCCAVIVYGYARLAMIHRMPSADLVSVAVVQPNIPQKMKWDPAARPYILGVYRQLAQEAAVNPPDLMIWPEAASPVVLGDDDTYFQRIMALSVDTGVPVLLGAVRISDDEYHNSALLIDREGGITQLYDKLHLVPFGEYIPLKNVFPFLESIVPIGDISRGTSWTKFEYKGVLFSVLICFEDLFPEISRRFSASGAQFLVNITNDAWYEETAAAAQHYQASVFRAVENRLCLARSANTGVSAIIRPDGSAQVVRDASGKAIFVNGFVRGMITGAKKPGVTIYTRFGDWFIILMLLVFVYSVVRLRRIGR
jgi:apolipoprotein N-acyltransferase